MIPRVWRLGFVMAILLISGLALFYRALVLQVVDQNFLRDQGEARSVRIETISAHRGLIEDRNGVPLAVSTPVKTIWANPTEINLQNFPFNKVARILKIKSKWLRQRLLDNTSRSFVYVQRKIAPDIAREIDALNLKGLYSRTAYKRFYPEGEVVAQLVGFTNIDEKGQEGLELAYNKWLSSIPGAKKVLKDRKGGVVKNLALIRPAKPGRTLQLSIDMRLQYAAYKELKAAVLAHHAASGALVMLDVKTGEVLAMASLPSYNPNNRWDLDLAGLRNRAIVDTFEPGSTMKPFTIAAALASGKFQVNSVLDTSPGYIRIGKYTIRDHTDYGRINLTKLISKSSNVGASKVAMALTGPVVKRMFQKVGFGKTTGTGFPGEGTGVLPTPLGRWRRVQEATMSYGYGESVTVLQLAQAYAVLAAHGVKRPISLLKVDGAVDGQQVMPRRVADEVVQMLRHVVMNGGTGRRARVPDYHVAGKTGTVNDVGRKGYESDKYRALFAGMAPMRSPRLVLVVVINDPRGGEYYGGEVAAPVFSRVMSDALRLMDIAPDDIPGDIKKIKPVWAENNNKKLALKIRG